MTTAASRKLPPEILTDPEVKRLMRACSSTAPTGVRNRALLVVLYRGGLRLGEALALRPKDIDREAGTVRVLHGKGDKARTVGMDPGAFAVLERWLDMRRARGINGRARVFCTLKKKPMSQDYVRQMLPRLARKSGIEKRVHAHGLRHAHAAQLAAEGLPINVIQAQLGHSNLSTTNEYLKRIAPAEVVAAMQAREWALDDTAPAAPKDPRAEKIAALQAQLAALQSQLAELAEG